MGVSRLDSLCLFGPNATVASGTTSTNFPIPVNGLVTFQVASTSLGGGTLTVQAFDGTNWNTITGLSITANGTYTWQGVALGLSAVLTGGTGATGLSVIAVLIEF